MGRRRRANRRRQKSAARRVGAATKQAAMAAEAARKGNVDGQNTRSIYDQKTGYKVPPNKKRTVTKSLWSKIRERAEVRGKGTVRRRTDARVDRSKHRFPIRRPSDAHHGGRLSPDERAQAEHRILHKEEYRDSINREFFKDN